MNKLVIQSKNFLWRQALKFLVNPKKVVVTHGNKMHLDRKDSLLLSLKRNYEPKHVKLIKSIVNKGDVVCDIGSNIGFFTLILAKLVGPQGKVYSFEPDPENFDILRKNVELNGYKNVVFEQAAVSNKKGKLMIYFSEINSGDTRIFQPGEEKENRESSSALSVKLDDYFTKKKEVPSFFKIDVQGAELKVFEGMKSILKSKKKIALTVEFSPEMLRSFGCKPDKMLKILRDYGFKLYDLDKQKTIRNDREAINYYEKINYFTTLFCER